jgi:hypothetical protein
MYKILKIIIPAFSSKLRYVILPSFLNINSYFQCSCVFFFFEKNFKCINYFFTSILLIINNVTFTYAFVCNEYYDKNIN